MNLPTTYRMLLFVAGVNDGTDQLRETIGRTLDFELHEEYSLEVIDVLSNPERAAEEEILITPTLIRKWPEPERRLFGDLTDTDRIRRTLSLAEEG